jgi:hypothetical protein
MALYVIHTSGVGSHIWARISGDQLECALSFSSYCETVAPNKDVH